MCTAGDKRDMLLYVQLPQSKLKGIQFQILRRASVSRSALDHRKSTFLHTKLSHLNNTLSSQHTQMQ